MEFQRVFHTRTTQIILYYSVSVIRLHRMVSLLTRQVGSLLKSMRCLHYLIALNRLICTLGDCMIGIDIFR